VACSVPLRSVLILPHRRIAANATDCRNTRNCVEAPRLCFVVPYRSLRCGAGCVLQLPVLRHLVTSTRRFCRGKIRADQRTEQAVRSASRPRLWSPLFLEFAPWPVPSRLASSLGVVPASGPGLGIRRPPRLRVVPSSLLGFGGRMPCWCGAVAGAGIWWSRAVARSCPSMRRSAASAEAFHVKQGGGAEAPRRIAVSVHGWGSAPAQRRFASPIEGKC
jgi:hypothetical protein